MEANKRTSLGALYRSFFMIGLLTFGGGYAMLPMLEREVVEKHGWTTRDELLGYYAIGQCTPGIIAVNTATFVGFKQAKVLGGIAATAGVISPSLIIILLIAALLGQVSDLAVVQHAFAGIRPVVGALIVGSVLKLFRSNVKQWWQVLLCIAAFVVIAVLGQSPVWVILGTALLGLAIGGWKGAKA